MNNNLRSLPKLRDSMIEVKPGVFLAKVSAIVRKALWEKVCDDISSKGAILAYSAPTETGFIMDIHGEPTRTIIDLDGLQLIKCR